MITSDASSFASALNRIATTRDPGRKEAALLNALQEAAKAMSGYEHRLAKLEGSDRGRAN